MSKIAICFLSTTVNIETFNFADSLKQDNYDIYICIDDNDIIIPNYDYNKINIIRINNDDAKLCGFTGSVVYCLDRPCSRDKALYYFCILDTSYDYTWFIEDDVFVPTKYTIKNIDEKYKSDDLLCEANHLKKSKDDNSHYWQHWPRLENKIEFPWAHSMICAVRVSKLLLKYICNFATYHQSLLFDETLFNTLAVHNNLSVTTPIELSTITFSFTDIDINENDINILYMYHPIKSVSKQTYLHHQFITS